MGANRVRKIEVVAQDPRVTRDGTTDGEVLTSVVSVPWEPLVAGPMGYAVHVVDHDASTGTFYEPAAMPDGDDDDVVRAPTSRADLLADPGYHAVNAYALVMNTLCRFEAALGRRVGWGIRGHQLKVVPHAFEEANAFYAPDAEAIMFGYTPTDPPIFLGLSHDVVVHETTHALLDALRDRFMAPSSMDQAALHEAFADIVALLSVFSFGDVLLHLIDRSIGGDGTGDADDAPEGMVDRRRLTEDALHRSVLLGLAEEMSELDDPMRLFALRRSVTIEPDVAILQSDEFTEEHRRGEVVVAAFMRAFVAAWARRIERLGAETSDYVDRELAAEQGATIADLLITMAIRGIDYTPPIHIRFPDFLSALLTADSEVRADDTRFELRATLVEQFASYGIVPRAPGTPEVPGRWDAVVDLLDRTGLHLVGLQNDETELFRLVWRNREALGLNPTAFTRIASVRPCVRISPDDGFQLRETVVELIQYVRIEASRLVDFGLVKPDDMDDGEELALEGGSTLILDEYGELKFNICNHIPTLEDPPDVRLLHQERLDYLWREGFIGKRRSTLANQMGGLHLRRTLQSVCGTAALDRREAW
jgi:hypothetical protein